MVTAREVTHLRLVAAIVTGEFVDEDQRGAVAGLFIIEADLIVRRDEGHGSSGLLRVRFAPVNRLISTTIDSSAKSGRADSSRPERLMVAVDFRGMKR